MAQQNFNLTQTGEEVQQILDTATPITDLQQEAAARQQADTTLQGNIDSEASARQGADTTLQGNIEAEAASRQQAIDGLAQQIALTLQDYYKKSETMSAQEIQTLVSQTISDYYTKLQVDALIQDFITKSVNDLTNYYLKTETFTKQEVQQLIAAVKQFRYQSVPVLPTASAETMNIIYLVPSANPKAENVKDEFITTSQTNEQGVTTYDWEQIGSTTVDLSGYSTTEQMNQAIASAIATALASYYTKSETMSTQQVNAAIEQAVNTALTAYYTKAQTDAAINAALANYYTKAQAGEAVTAAIATALAAYYTKTEVNALLDTIRQSVTAETNARTDADATLRGLIQQVSTSLVNYYLKTETYSRSEVQQLVDNVRQFQYKVVTTLPQPTADTVGWIYLVPGSHTETQNVKEEYITILEGSSYKWEHIGSTNVDLSGYSTTQEMNAAIASALASYYTKTQVDEMVQTINTAISQKQDTISDLDTIRSGSAAGATALQPAALTPYYTKTETDNLLGQKQAVITDGAQIGLGFGVSSEAATVQARTATIASFILLKNMPVSIRFTNAINVDNATLNINSQGAKPLFIQGAALQAGVVNVDDVVTLIYDGTNWNIVDILNVAASKSGLFVDMGLPSGLRWAIANLDATTQSGFAEVDGKPSPFKYEGTFFSWGNTEGHNPISESAFSYDWGTGNDGPYAHTPGAALTANAGLSYDAARAILGAPYRLPTTEEFAELFANIDYVQADGETVIDASQANKLVTVNNIMGIYLKSKINGNLLFFPCSGVGYGSSWGSRGSNGNYWYSSLYSATDGRVLYFYSGGVYPQGTDNRFYGFAGRAVQ